MDPLYTRMGPLELKIDPCKPGIDPPEPLYQLLSLNIIVKVAVLDSSDRKWAPRITKSGEILPLSPPLVTGLETSDGDSHVSIPGVMGCWQWEEEESLGVMNISIFSVRRQISFT